eukprot:Gb_38018 [translate_table: standard]
MEAKVLRDNNFGFTMENRSLAAVDSLGYDVWNDILRRLPAKSFASAACVSRTWRNSAAKILSRPKLMSAVSENLNLEAAVDEIMEKILAAPIRPDFAIAFAGQKFSLSMISSLLKEKLGSRVPTIVCFAPGIIGQDAITNEQKEVEWRQPAYETSKATRRRILAEQHGLVVTIGYFPGLEIEAIPLCSSVVEEGVNTFVSSVMDYASSLSDCAAPLAMILLVDPRADIKHVLESLDEKLHGNTVIVGGLTAENDEACLSFNIRNTVKMRREYQLSSIRTKASGSSSNRKSNKRNGEKSVIFDGAALVFAKKHESFGSGRIHFSPAVSAGIAPVGPIYKAVSVKQSKDVVNKESYTWLTCRKGLSAELDGQSVLDDLDNEVGGNILSEDLYIGVLKRSKRFMSSSKDKATNPFTIHKVHGADQEYLFVEGEGIRTGDVFRFYRTNPEIGKLSCNLALEQVRDRLRSSSNHDELLATTIEMGANTANEYASEVFGGLIFSCNGRGQSFFGDPNVDSSIFSQKFPDVPVAGMFCLGEIGPPSVLSWEATEGSDTNSRLNFYSAMFLVFSHTSDCDR